MNPTAERDLTDLNLWQYLANCLRWGPEGVEGVIGVDSTVGGMSGWILCKGTLVLLFRDETLGAVCPRVERRVDTVVTDERVCLV
jgi:hypothetical protein